MVEHKGFEPLTSSMPWKRASQLRQCPINRDIITKLPLLYQFRKPSIAVCKTKKEQQRKTPPNFGHLFAKILGGVDFACDVRAHPRRAFCFGFCFWRAALRTRYL